MYKPPRWELLVPPHRNVHSRTKQHTATTHSSTCVHQSHQGQSIVKLRLDLVSETVGVGGQLEVILGVAFLCNTPKRSKNKRNTQRVGVFRGKTGKGARQPFVQDYYVLTWLYSTTFEPSLATTPKTFLVRQRS